MIDFYIHFFVSSMQDANKIRLKFTLMLELLFHDELWLFQILKQKNLFTMNLFLQLELKAYLHS